MNIKKLYHSTIRNTRELVPVSQFYDRINSVSGTNRGVITLSKGGVCLDGHLIIHVTRQRNPLITVVFVADNNMKIHLNNYTAVPREVPSNRRVPAKLVLMSHEGSPVMVTKVKQKTSVHVSPVSLKVVYEPSKITRVYAKT